ncbi:hypothetical protein JMJ35_003020 [Cladonia borealis]|uniref:Cytochrome oxidase complex assembly protein n=1 Tax=Cladonia borealis TaxID=184061 RepID=A0AA39R6V3_9LECA|nr:hypothetical protein JMJ35_003020 [Cladonia borealis]
MKPRLPQSLLPLHSRPSSHLHRSAPPFYSLLPRPPLHHRTLIAPPAENSGPLMTRRSDRALPSPRPSWLIWARTMPIFLIIITISALGIFNYQKSSSSVVAATLYALRTSEIGKRELGEEIYFRDMFPWISGEMNQLHGRVNIAFGVKGTKGRGVMRFKSVRRGRTGKFETVEWSLETEDGRKIQLLDEGRVDPLEGTAIGGNT